MDEIVEKTVSDEEIAKFAVLYEKAKEVGKNEPQAKYDYAYTLIRSQHNDDIKHGIRLLENLYHEDETSRRGNLYYIAIGQTRLKKYNVALDHVDLLLSSEPENHQAKKLRSYIKGELTKDGLMGMAITGGAALVLGGLIGLGLSLAKK